MDFPAWLLSWYGAVIVFAGNVFLRDYQHLNYIKYLVNAKLMFNWDCIDPLQTRMNVLAPTLQRKAMRSLC